MHWRAHADHMTDFATYDDPGGVVAAVRDELAERVDAALAAGIAPERLVLDPGLGFAKRGEHNWQLLADLGPIKALGYPLLVGASRKSFLGTLLADADGTPAPGRRAARTPPPPSAWCSPGRGCGGCACTTYAPLATPCECCTRSTPLGRRANTCGRARPDRAGVLGPPRRLRARAPRGPAVRHRPRPGRRHRRRSGIGRLVSDRRLRKSRVVGESRRREGSGRPDRDARPADRGGLPLGRPC